MASAVGIPEIRDRLNVMLKGVDGVRAVYKYWPPNLQDVETPCFLVVPSAGDHDEVSSRDHGVNRRWRIFLLIGKWSVADYGSMQKVLDPLYERVEDLFIEGYQLNALDPQVYNASVISDTGEQVIEFPPRSGQMWLGTEFTLMISTYRRITRSP